MRKQETIVILNDTEFLPTEDCKYRRLVIYVSKLQMVKLREYQTVVSQNPREKKNKKLSHDLLSQNIKGVCVFPNQN